MRRADPSLDHDQLTSTSPYAGTLSAFSTGVKLRTRYHHLLPNREASKPLKFWASDCTRIIDTAKYLMTGLLGYSWPTQASLQIIPETSDLGGDTLTPGDTCLAYRSDKKRGHDYGYTQLWKYRDTYLPAIATRLHKENSAIRFGMEEVYVMQEMCGFETLARGSSPWCGVFSHDEWKNFEYARDVLHFYRTGPGNPYSKAMGSLWADATAKLLAKGGEEAGRMFLSVAHDGDVLPVMNFLGLFDGEELPVTHRKDDRRWRSGQLVPMMGRLIVELMSCSADGHNEDSVKKFVRIDINDGVTAIPLCQSGPAGSCPLEDFLRFVETGRKEAGSFSNVCKLDSSGGEEITFLHQ